MVDIHLGCFQFGVNTNAPTINILMHISKNVFLLDVYLRMELQCHKVFMYSI